ncbi:bifunctional DNA primase/polymerase [Saccharibacillus deserti]|uniref:bifunctional DNA primase/polymerase n=1 Tax=Saccharibacillus deserti TaxID=1634444 RepID=UPI0015561C8E|nr:bifunctional DNA primase/polymerase [Saccharibacillus deserti]
MIEQAKDYAHAGFHIIPMCPADHAGMSARHIEVCRSPGKRPLIRGWQNAGIPSDAEIEKWFRKWPQANIGMALGQQQGFVAIDLDGDFGRRKLEELSKGELPDTWQFSTPGGGMRYLFAAPKDYAVQKYAISDPNPEAQHSELLLLGEHSCTVLPPSKHRNGGYYEWIKPPQFIRKA